MDNNLPTKDDLGSFLFESLAEATAATTQHATVRVRAVGGGCVASVAALLTCPEVVAAAGPRLLHIAQDNAEIVALLLTCDSIRGAAGTGSVIDEHFFYDAHYRRGTTPLMTAVQFNFERAVAALLACDTVAHTAGAQDGLGRTALIHAVRGGRSPGLLRSLLACEQVRSAGNAHDHDGFTALVHAIVQCDDVAVSVLLECKDIADTAGAPIAGGGFFPGFTPGFTPLMLASEGKNARVTKALLACPHVQQTAFSARNVHGENAYDLACKRGDNVDVAQWIAAFRPTTPFT